MLRRLRARNLPALSEKRSAAINCTFNATLPGGFARIPSALHRWSPALHRQHVGDAAAFDIRDNHGRTDCQSDQEGRAKKNLMASGKVKPPCEVSLVATIAAPP